MDDGSTDGSREIVQGHSDDRVRYVFQRNRGACAARNLGLSLARGNYIQFFDSDDILHPEKIHRQVEMLDHNPGKLASSSWQSFRFEPGDVQMSDAPIYRDLTPREYFEHILHDRGDIPLPAWLLPRSTVERVGCWDESLRINQDGEYLARLVAASGGSIHVSGFTGFYYRRRDGSISSLNSKEKVHSAITVLDRTAELAANCGVEVASTRIADHYYRLMTNSYPHSRSLLPELYERITRYGGRTFGPRLGGRSANFFAKVVGWKTARLLQNQLRRVRAMV